MGVLMLVGFGWLVTLYRRPVLLAVVYSGVSFALGLVFGAGGVPALLHAAIAGGFALPYFWLLDRCSDTVLLWLTVLIGFPVLWTAVSLSI
ncbi:hypothetical protein KBTX_00671 [wastewater metagenome]|uniref:Uncharacterized protein n=2 Tax=unclassified sequences TaxID=12908 RepID=A0A5B8R8R6_9ZZZZ|nr:MULTISPECIES: hypothetical protein [Arhodomonas]MCS4505506.1 hypothetical protein [Arhodomonas aquaeolei]QEA04363.1 hypothetical protein KBTEX_00671 [uncultured organism]